MGHKTKWKYERGEGRFKHCWKNPYAGFKPSKRGPVGKCSSHIDDKIAQTLVDTGIPFYEYEDDDYPSIIYNLYEGVVYEAVPTTPGFSYHGFPWYGKIPRKVLEELERRARNSGFETEFKRWLKAYMK